MNQSDREAILHAIRTFRIGAPLLLSDVRFACWADGHDIRHIPSKSMPSVMRELCDPVDGKWGPHDYKSWIRRR